MSSSERTQIVFSNEAQDRLFKGLEKAANAVGCTLGPKGKVVIIAQGDEQPIVTKDGVTVSKAICLSDPLERMGGKLIKEAADRTNEVAGDGTTTATVLTHGIVKEGLKLLKAGFDASELKRGIELATEHIISALQQQAKDVTTIEETSQIATISANNDADIGKLIATAINTVGKHGIVTVEDAKGMQTSLEKTEGLRLERGYLSPYFATDTEKMHTQFIDARVLLTDVKLSTMKPMLPILEQINKSQQSLVIIADDVEGEALQTLVVNKLNGNLKTVAIKAPGFGHLREQLLQDLAVLTGAKIVSAKTGLSIEKCTLNDLGFAAKVTVDAKSTTIITDGRTKEAVEAHAQSLEQQLTDVTLSTDELKILQLRLANLVNGVAIMKVGGATEIEMIERKHRIEDALNATRAAIEEGIVPGGGMALYNCSKLPEPAELTPAEKQGYQAMLRACRAPIAKIISNAALVPEVIMAKIDTTGLGFNAATGMHTDLIQAGIIDPAKVTRVAIENAASVASIFLSLDAAIFEEETHGSE